MFGISRQRGSTPSLSITTTAGEDLTLLPDGGFTPNNPSYSESTSAGDVAIQIIARDFKEARNILKGVKKKYPNIYIEEVLAGAQVSSKYPKGLIQHQLDFGGPISGRSIVKSVLALAHNVGIPVSACFDATNYLRDLSATRCYGFYQAIDLIKNRPSKVPLHCIAIEVNPCTGFILGYAEFFGVHRVVACLGQNYLGKLIQANYTIDPRNGEELKVFVSLDFKMNDIYSIYENKMVPVGSVEAAFLQVIPTALNVHFENEKARVIKIATEYAFSICGAKQGYILTAEHLKKLSELLFEKLMPFLIRNTR